MKKLNGDVIRTLRVAKKRNQTWLAKMVGLSTGMVSKYERGEVEELDLNIVDKFAKALGVPVGNLLTGNDTASYTPITEAQKPETGQGQPQAPAQPQMAIGDLVKELSRLSNSDFQRVVWSAVQLRAASPSRIAPAQEKMKECLETEGE